MRRGRLVVLEGPEGAGKTSQLRRLIAYLAAENVPCLALREPGGTGVGNEIRRLLLDSGEQIGPRAEALLFMASRAELVQHEIVPALAAGTLVLLDRFFLSTYAYQIAGRGLPEDEVRRANDLARDGLVPDVTVLLTVPAAERDRRMVQRGSADRIERAGEVFHRAVERAFDAFLDPAWQAAHPECGPIVAVDGGADEERVFQALMAALAARWPETFLLGNGSHHQ